MPSSKTILVVDDDLDIREAVVDTLIDEGYEAVAVGDGAAGLDYLRDRPAPGLVLLDWNMTPMNGLDFMREVAKEPLWASVPIALLTADAKAEDKVKLASFVGYLRKPMKLPDLLGLVERYCG
jgi:CheY-like chemotaxis protein